MNYSNATIDLRFMFHFLLIQNDMLGKLLKRELAPACLFPPVCLFFLRGTPIDIYSLLRL